MPAEEPAVAGYIARWRPLSLSPQAAAFARFRPPGAACSTTSRASAAAGAGTETGRQAAM